MTAQELSQKVEEARRVKEEADARIRTKVDQGEEPTKLDLAHLKVAEDNYFHGVRLLTEAKG